MGNKITPQQRKTGELVSQLGEHLHATRQEGAGCVLLYAQIDEECLSLCVYDEFEDRVVARIRSEDELTTLLYDLWYVLEPKDRWCELEAFWDGSLITARFFYPDQQGIPRDIYDDRQEILGRYFGNKPNEAPPLVGTREYPVYELKPDGSWVPIHDLSVDP